MLVARNTPCYSRQATETEANQFTRSGKGPVKREERMEELKEQRRQLKAQERRDLELHESVVGRKKWAKKLGGAAGVYVHDEEGTGDQARRSILKAWAPGH